MQTLLVVTAMSDAEHEELLLADATGKPLVEHAWENAKACTAADVVVVTTSSPAIARHLDDLGANVVMTSAECVFATDKLYELYRNGWHDFETFVVLHANEPEVCGQMLDLCAAMTIPGSRQAATLACQIDDPHLVTRVKLQLHGDNLVQDVFRLKPPYSCYRGMGVFAYRRELLCQWKQLPKARAERWDLELAAVIDGGKDVNVKVVDGTLLNIENSDDYRTWFLKQR